MVKGSVELMGMRSILQDFGYRVSLDLSTDATAAIGMVVREGLGKVRHLAVADLWVQDRERLGDINYRKFEGHDNPADAMTKGIGAEPMERHLAKMEFVQAPGRHRLAPELINDHS